MFRVISFRSLTLGALAAAALTVVAGAAAAQGPEVNVSAGLTAKGAPLALRGYDPVSYFTDGGPQPGKAEVATTYQGATYRFASRKNLRRFEGGPRRYAPQYGGFCAYGVSVGAKFDGDPLVWKVVDGKLYLNLNSEIQKAWNADIEGAVKKADAHWTKIRSAAPEELAPQG